MSEFEGQVGARIRSIIERVENVEAEIKELNEGKKEIFAEAKADGFDTKVLKEIIKMRKEEKAERDERDALLDLYMRAIEGAEVQSKAA
ncbi:MAG: DUF2312 domain-containing protein [Beijerinckiaceae bacterium]|nr:DUF2312 domain-containing protein [Beijerinckiaceae bacterium]